MLRSLTVKDTFELVRLMMTPNVAVLVEDPMEISASRISKAMDLPGTSSWDESRYPIAQYTIDLLCSLSWNVSESTLFSTEAEAFKNPLLRTSRPRWYLFSKRPKTKFGISSEVACQALVSVKLTPSPLPHFGWLETGNRNFV